MAEDRIAEIAGRVAGGDLRQDDSRWLLSEVARLAIELRLSQKQHSHTIDAHYIWRSKVLRARNSDDLIIP
jgi:hypothetical protein